ncbi:hypothetical protein GCM10007874_46140 [Labrys miyagiensis]|uniref:Tetratricopeptide repeat protein n=2 Tax=Labrys miyagiensis TaxID=346912 RepID=A0ABQ6CTM0_9HYPH|nr:hypothetical protein GCM10007874_46140 [Labrys miyagiensis]
MGFDGFVASIRDKLHVPYDAVFSIDFSTFRERESFFDTLHTRINATFSQICEAISEIGPSILIFDDVDLAASHQAREIEADIEKLASAVTDYAGQAHCIIRSRRQPKSPRYRVIELRVLDEADLAVYASESEIGGSRYGKPDAASLLLRHTDGVPTRIDDALRDLEVVSLRDLLAANPDFVTAGEVVVGTPPALITSVHELQKSQERSEQRAYELLLALSALPQGEQLGRLARFLGVHPFGPVHARALLERSLIDAVGLSTVDASADNTGKALIVPRPVRDYVRASMDPAAAASTDRKALDLYFGRDWASGSISSSSTGKRVRAALCDGYEIQNASTLVLRNARRSLDGGEATEIEASIRLATAFVEALMHGSHYRAASGLCEDMVQLLQNYSGHDKELAVFNYEFARNLRMIGRIEEAIEIFESLNEDHLSKLQKQQAALGLALSYESRGDEMAAATSAQRVIAIDQHSNLALQARVIITNQMVDEFKREVELK